MPKIYEHAKNMPRLRKAEELLFGILTVQNHIITCFSTNLRQCNIAYSVIHVQLCFKSILFTAIVAAN